LHLRRYAGSRLHDPESEAYVSADDFERLREERRRITVRDAGTSQDVTEACLDRRMR